MSNTIARLALVGLCCATTAASQADDAASAARQAYLDLTAAHRVLFVARSPDHVDPVALAWCRRGLGLSTAVFHATDGAAADHAARIARIDEACRVARALDAAAHFGHLERLDDDRALESTVRAIRSVRPHVVLVAGDGDGEAVSALVARAIAAAADRDRFDDHLQDLLYPWRVRRAFARADGDVAASFRVPATGVGPVGGASFALLAATALGVEGPPPSRAYRIAWPDGEVARGGAAVDVMLGGIEAFDRDELGLRKDEDYARVREIEARVVKAGRSLLEDGASIDEGLAAFLAMRDLNDRPYATRTLDKTNDYIDEIGFQGYFRQRFPQISAVMRHVLGISVTPEVETGTFAPGERFAVDVRVSITGEETLDNLVVTLSENESFRVVLHGQGRRTLTAAGPVGAEMKVAVKGDAVPTVPASARALTRAGAPLGMQCTISGRFRKNHFGFTVPIEMPGVRAAVTLTATPARIGGEVTASLRTDGPMFAFGGRPKDRPMRFKVWLDAPEGAEVTPASRIVDVRRAGETVTARFDLGGKVTDASGVTLRTQCLDADGAPVGRVVSTTVPIAASR